MKSLDTNVLVYLVDDRDSFKRERARSIIAEALGNPQYVISGQVLNEFANIAMKKQALTEDETLAYVTEFRGIRTVETRSCLTDRALEIKKEHGLQFYDSLVLATAEACGCNKLLTEDLNEGQVYAGVRAVNPFVDRQGTGRKP